jgi:Cu(I)/Ag(I) efflux system protein CusF
MKKRLIAAALAAMAAGVTPAAFAHAGHDHSVAAPQSAEGEGVVRAINAQAGTVTVDHGPIAALNWPAMTMAFPVQSPALLNGVSVGSRVHFVLVNHEGHPMISEIHVQAPASN